MILEAQEFFSFLLMIESFLNNKYLFLVHPGMFLRSFIHILSEEITYGFVLSLFCSFLALLNDLCWNVMHVVGPKS